MKKRTFYRRWLATAFWHPFGVADYFSTALGILIPLIAKLSPKWGAALSDLVWQIPLTALGTLFGVRLILAPYWLYEERDKSATAQEESLRGLIKRQEAQLDTREARIKERIKRRMICEGLVTLSQEGDEILNLIVTIRKERPELIADWEARAVEFLSTHLNNVYVARLTSESGKIAYPGVATYATRPLLDKLHTKLERIKHFIEELCIEIDKD